MSEAGQATQKPRRNTRGLRRGPGGKREGAGRKPHTVMVRMAWDRLSLGVDLRSDQLSPKEILRIGARVMLRAALRRQGQIDRVCLKESMEYANMAAGYFDPKLSYTGLFGRRPAEETPKLNEKVVGSGAVVSMPNNGRMLVQAKTVEVGDTGPKSPPKSEPAE